MASKDNKTSKTARVMNLLSKKSDPVAEEETAAPAPAAPVPPIVTSMAPDAAVSGQIKSALEDALESELSAQQPAPVPQAAPAAPAQPQATPVQSEPAPAPQPEPVQEPESPIMWHDAPLPIPPSPGYMNVMQVLVEEKAPKYIEMFGLCSCKRCLEDVKAITLNHLPPKYVVLERGDMIPRLTVYEGKFSSDITAQLLQACKLVMERPHHGR